MESERYTSVPDEVTLVLPAPAQPGQWQAGAVLTILEAETGEDVTECVEPVKPVGSTLEANGILLTYEELNFNVSQADAVSVKTKYDTYYPGDDVNAELLLDSHALEQAGQMLWR